MRGGHFGAALRVLVLALLLAIPGLRAAQAQDQDNPLVQRGVPAEATAADAVVAREQALNAGQRLAYERMAASLGLPTNASTQQIESLVRSLVIESEHISARSYSARITVNFNQQRVAAAGGRLPSPDLPPASGPLGPDQPPAAVGLDNRPAVTAVEALAVYRSFGEWLEISRRLAAAAPVARVDVLSIAGDRARLRLGLRQMPQDAAADIAASGLALTPSLADPRGGFDGRDPRGGFDGRDGRGGFRGGEPRAGFGGGDPRPGEGWRLSLAGGR